jgi:crotonobetainyl-CoA:carnitine CoA-transferase CaiB-like acyl-CoA transferase
MNKSPLKGIVVVELAEALAGPYASMMLGDLGADVIKIERPGKGDQSRSWGPPFVGDQSAYYLSTNRNKRSMTIDLKLDSECLKLQKLLAKADVFITNIHKSSSLKKYGIDYESLSTVNKKIIYSAISGYGHAGINKGLPGYDILAQAASGLMSITGPTPGEFVRFPTPMADISAGLYSVIAILAALFARDRATPCTGQFIDISLIDAQLSWLSNVAGSYFANGKNPTNMGNIHPTISPYQPVMAKDKLFIVAAGTERLWSKFCTTLGLESLISDTRFSTNPLRNANRADLISIVETKLADKNASEWISLLHNNEIPSGPINLVSEALNDPHIISREMIVELEHPALGLIKNLGSPIKFSNTQITYRKHPPTLGEHTEEIISEFGLE